MEKVNEVLNNYKYPLLLGLVGFVLIFSGSFSGMFTQSHEKPIPKESLVSNEQAGEVIKVDIAGAVEKPGIFTLSKNARVDDLLKMAGGIKSDANAEFVAKQLNLSQKLNDGQKIYIPYQGEKGFGSVAGATTSLTGEISGNLSAASKVNLNSSTQAQLEELPGIGPSTAQKIIASRPFSSVEELIQKKAVGKSVYDKIKELVDI